MELLPKRKNYSLFSPNSAIKEHSMIEEVLIITSSKFQKSGVFNF